MPLYEATLHGSAGIAVLTLVSTLAICCVFASVVFLEGPAKYLFTLFSANDLLAQIRIARMQPSSVSSMCWAGGRTVDRRAWRRQQRFDRCCRSDLPDRAATCCPAVP